MPSIVNTNLNSLIAQNNLSTSQASLATSMQRLSSGLRINSAKDDAAGLAISQRMTAQINGSSQAARNANDGISLAQTAEGALSQIGSNLQRMRELAVQSANGTNSASDRAALNNEVQALSQEIDRVAQSASFNGVNLLDGSFSSQKFQVGANATANDSIAVAQIASARTSALGGSGTSTVTTTTGAVTVAGLAAGDLTLNGQQVGASGVGVAAGQSAASAFSIAAAINAISSSTGVTASTNASIVTGTAAAITSFTTIAAGTFSINGVAIGAVAAGGDAAGQGANVAAAINLVASQTGVSAAADAVSGALTLSTADGRDIAIGLNGTVANAAAAATNKTAFLSQTGLASASVGTQASSAGTTAQAVGSNIPNGAFITSIGRSGSVNNLTVSYNGGAFVAITPFANIGNFGIDGINFQNAINAALGFGATSYAGGAVQNVSTNNLTFAIGGTAPDLATANANKVALLAATGLNSGELGTQAVAVSEQAAAVASTHGSVTLFSNSATGVTVGGGNSANAGLTAGTTAPSTTLSISSISSIDVLTATSATNALTAIDGALTSVNASRAQLGAIQNRFTSVVASLQTTAQNLTASVSRIQDADFAAETANLSRSQILQQAGTAMVAQANQLPQGVLSLLR